MFKVFDMQDDLKYNAVIVSVKLKLKLHKHIQHFTELQISLPQNGSCEFVFR